MFFCPVQAARVGRRRWCPNQGPLHWNSGLRAAGGERCGLWCYVSAGAQVVPTVVSLERKT